MKKIATALLSLTALGASPALAQEVGPSFTGPRVEALLGYDNIGAGSSVSTPGSNQNSDGLLYGAAIGYDFAAGPAVLGVDAEISDSTGSVDYNNGPSGAQPNAYGFGQVSTGRDLYVGARAGIRATPANLVYIKGGYTNARLNAYASNGTSRLDGNFDLSGYRVGAGVEHAFGPRSYAKLEYRYSNYSNADFKVNGQNTGYNNLAIDTDRHQILVGVGMRF